MSKKAYFITAVLGIILSQTWALRAAAMEEFDEEVYSNTKTEVDPSDDPESDEYGKINIQLTKRGEEDDRIAEESFPQVKGAERLMDSNEALALKVPMQNKMQFNPTSTETPTRSGRTLASVSQSTSSNTARPKQFVSTVDIPEAPSAAQTGNSEWDSRVTNEPKPVKPGIYQEISLIVSDAGYYPNRIFVTPNIPVRMYMSTPSKTTLCFMIDNWGVKKGVSPGKVEEVQFTPDKPGNYRFYCPVKGIEGTLTVREPQAAPSRDVASTTKPEPVSVATTVQRPEPKKLKMLTDDE